MVWYVIGVRLLDWMFLHAENLGKIWDPHESDFFLANFLLYVSFNVKAQELFLAKDPK
jgi:hypothetical protein